MAKNSKRDILTDSLNKVKMHDAGEKIKNNESKPVISKREISYPSMWLNNKQVPELSGSEVGDDLLLVIRAKITSHSQRDHINMSKERRNRETFDLEITKIGIIKK